MRCGYNNEVPNCFECKKRDYDNWAKCNGVESLITVYIVKNEDCGSSVFLDNTDDVITTSESFLVDENGYERNFTDKEIKELLNALDDMVVGSTYFGSNFTVECKQMTQKEFDNLPELEGC